MAEDALRGRLIIINPAITTWYGMALIVDVHTGRVLSTVQIGQGPTAVQIDAQLHRAYYQQLLS